MRSVLVLLFLLVCMHSFSQSMTPEWYILEKGSTVGIIKPGVNDLTLYLAASKNKPVDKAAVEFMEKSISYIPGNVVLIYANLGNSYMATDMEGRNIVVRGKITKVSRGAGCGVACLKTDLKTSTGIVPKGTYVWMKEHKPGQQNVLIQYSGNNTASTTISQIYDINQTMFDMAKSVKVKNIQ
ncbi:MAG: hypothetical protein JST82_13300 [Bacteroidetes bacterium]|nr:hypothetical protein [Bacteroidota bacterium]